MGIAGEVFVGEAGEEQIVEGEVEAERFDELDPGDGLQRMDTDIQLVADQQDQGIYVYQEHQQHKRAD